MGWFTETENLSCPNCGCDEEGKLARLSKDNGNGYSLDDGAQLICNKCGLIVYGIVRLHIEVRKSIIDKKQVNKIFQDLDDDDAWKFGEFENKNIVADKTILFTYEGE